MKKRTGFTLVEALLAMSLVGVTMALLAMLFQRSLNVLATIEGKERSRQAGRMGLDRLTSELREATLLKGLGATLEFEKIDPGAEAVPPLPAPMDVPEDFVPPDYTPLIAYPQSTRLEVRYSTTSQEALIREVRLKGSGSYVQQVVVVGVNSFVCTQNPENPGEVEVVVSVHADRRITTLSSRVLCPCIKEPFE